MEKQKSTVPMKSANKVQITQLTKDLGIAVQIDNLNVLLNSEPPRQWYKNHKGIDYLPIDRVKNNLITIFQDYDWSIKDVRIMANSVVIFGTLSVVNPVTGRVRNLDGVGAWPIQLDSGAKPLEIDKIKQDAMQKNAPAAESLAIKNAAQKLGKLFGGGSDDVDFAPAYSREVPLDEIKKGFENATN